MESVGTANNTSYKGIGILIVFSWMQKLNSLQKWEKWLTIGRRGSKNVKWRSYWKVPRKFLDVMSIYCPLRGYIGIFAMGPTGYTLYFKRHNLRLILIKRAILSKIDYKVHFGQRKGWGSLVEQTYSWFLKHQFGII